jgi:tetratricopeptide (TPR) repeat protein
MKKIIYTIVALLFVFQIKAQDSLLLKGNQDYTEQKYNEAIAVYEQLLGTGVESAELYFNLGNAYYKAGKITPAILNYERAKLLAPDDADIQFNLDLANQHVVDAIDALPQVFFIRWWNNLIKSKSTDTWAMYSIVSFIVFLLLLGLYVFSSNGRLRRLGFWFGILVLAGSVFTFVFANKQKNRIENHNFAIITQPSVTVKSSPSESGTNIFLIHEGLKVQLIDQVGNWYEIRLADGNQGWLQTETLEKI